VVKDRSRKPPSIVPASEPIWPLIVFGVLCTIGYLVYVAVVVDPRFIYNTGGLIVNFPSFYYGWGHLAERLARPGGICQYASGFLAQWYCHRWLGAAVIVSMAALSMLCSYWYLRILGLGWIGPIASVGPVAVLAVHNQYVYALDVIFAYTVAVAAACLVLRSFNSPGKRAIFACALIPFVYWAIGGTGLLTAMLLVIAGITRKEGWLTAIAACSAFLWPYILGVVLLGQDIRTAYASMTPWAQSSAHGTHKADITLWAL
jgi:hypothetical protein